MKKILIAAVIAFAAVSLRADADGYFMLSVFSPGDCIILHKARKKSTIRSDTRGRPRQASVICHSGSSTTRRWSREATPGNKGKTQAA